MLKYMRMCKTCGSTLTQKHNSAARLIQQWYRTQRKKYKIMNSTDVFTHEPFITRPFRITRNKQIYQFEPISFFEYILDSGKFENPYTRELLTDRDLESLRECVLMQQSEPLKVKIGQRTIYIDPTMTVQELRLWLINLRKKEREMEDLYTYLRESCDTVVDIILNRSSFSYNPMSMNYNIIEFIIAFDTLRTCNHSISHEYLINLWNRIFNHIHTSNINVQIVLQPFFDVLMNLLVKFS